MFFTYKHGKIFKIRRDEGREIPGISERGRKGFTARGFSFLLVA